MKGAIARGLSRPRTRRSERERGIALVMVLGAVTILAIMLVEIQEEASAERAAAVAAQDAVQAEYLAKSAINLSRLIIASEPVVRKAMAPLFMMMKRSPPQLPVWEFSDRLLGAFNDQEGASDFAATSGLSLSGSKNLGLGLDNARFEVVIIDEDSKMNANMGAQNQIAHIRLTQQLMAHMMPITHNPFFEKRDANGYVHDRQAICQALIDWADNDEQRWSCDVSTTAPASQALEDYSFYSQQKRPYKVKNAPFDSLEELRLVRGIGDEFWAKFIDKDPRDPRQRDVTVWGQGAVNVNSANPTTLLALLCSGAGAPESELCTDVTQTAMFLTGVTMAKGISMGAPLFGTPQDFINTMKGQGMLGPILMGMGLKPIRFKSEAEFAKAVSTESKFFSIYAIGVKKGYKRETRVSAHAVVDFRAAPNITQGGGLPGTAPGTAAGALPGATPTGQAGSTANAGGTTQDAIVAAMRPSTGGQVVYYRID